MQSSETPVTCEGIPTAKHTPIIPYPNFFVIWGQRGCLNKLTGQVTPHTLDTMPQDTGLRLRLTGIKVPEYTPNHLPSPSAF